MRKFAVAVALGVLLAGCGTPRPDPAQERLLSMKAQAERGEAKFSDYYLAVYQDIERRNGLPNKGFLLKTFNDAIDVAKRYEAGLISRDQLESHRRKMNAEMQADKDRREEEARLRRASEPMPKFFTPPRTTNCTSTVYGNSVSTSCN